MTPQETLEQVLAAAKVLEAHDCVYLRHVAKYVQLPGTLFLAAVPDQEWTKAVFAPYSNSTTRALDVWHITADLDGVEVRSCVCRCEFDPLPTILATAEAAYWRPPPPMGW